MRSTHSVRVRTPKCVFATCNIAGSQPWSINGAVLDVMVRVFRQVCAYPLDTPHACKQSMQQGDMPVQYAHWIANKTDIPAVRNSCSTVNCRVYSWLYAQPSVLYVRCTADEEAHEHLARQLSASIADLTREQKVQWQRSQAEQHSLWATVFDCLLLFYYVYLPGCAVGVSASDCAAFS